MSEHHQIVVGMDASAEARAALDWARSVAGPDDRIAVVHAYTTPIALIPAYLPSASAIVSPDESHQLAEEQLGRILGGVIDRRITSWVIDEPPGQAITDAAGDADMVVVGHRGDSQMSMMLGSTANYVLHHAKQPVVVVRGATPAAPRTVVVGVDGHPADATTSESVRALQWAYQLPDVEEIRVVHAWSPYPYAWELGQAVMVQRDALEEAAHAVIDSVIELAGPAPGDVSVSRTPVEGSTAAALIQESEEADLLVVGTRGRGGFRGLLVGSTSTTVAGHSHIPVAVIR